MNIYQEVTPLKTPDVFVVLDSCNNGFDYPIHNHPEYELNLVMGMCGTRIVGDSTERYTDFDLVLLGPYLYHKWDGDKHLQENGQPYRVITIQFAMGLISGQFFQKEQFNPIRKLLQDSSEGIKFYGETLKEAIQLMIKLTEDKGFGNVLEFLQLLNVLSRSSETSYLSSEGFSTKVLSTHSHRVQMAYSYILKNFEKHDLKIKELSTLLNMSDSAFSHFFQKYAFRSFTQFLLDIRIGHACKLLLDTEETIGQICFKSGFNNISNFNRLFKKYRRVTPVDFRKRYLGEIEFDWRNQVTPWQFLPPKNKLNERVKPETYETRLVHV
ncbi:MAG: AraC family transcriptional regulator [Saprospiraceae bacterium]